MSGTEVQLNELTRIGVVGAGLMGSGIAESVARAGFDVVVEEPAQPALDRSRQRIEQSLQKAAQRGRVDDVGAVLDKITWTTDLDALSGADIVCEAIVEDAQAKGRLFQRLDALLPDAQLLSTNTSSIPIAEIAS